MDETVQRRLAHNEDLFREVNEAIAKGLWPGDSHPARFRCECAALRCNETVELSRGEYEEVRGHPRQFVVLPGHEQHELEEVVARRPGYVVVVKLGVAGIEAQELDPRT